MSGDSDSLSRPVEVKITVQIGVRLEAENLVISFRYNPSTYHKGEAEARIPLQPFYKETGDLDPQRLNRFFASVMTAFEFTKTYALERDLQLHFADIVRLLMVSGGMVPGMSVSQSVQELSEAHKTAVDDSLHRMMLTLREDGRRPRISRSRRWTAITLTAAIAEASAALRPGQDFNYQNIHRRIKEFHPKTAPKNLAAFKKLTQRLGIQWKAIKAQKTQASGTAVRFNNPTAIAPKKKMDI